MSYSEQFFENWKRRREERIERDQPKPVEHSPVESTTWKPWNEMTAEERRKALSQREDATPRPSGR